MKTTKYYVIPFFFFVWSISFCQSKKILIIEYDFKLILNNINNFNAILYQNDSICIFKYTNNNIDNKLNEVNGNYKFYVKDSTDNITYSNKHRGLNIEVVKGFNDVNFYQIIDSIKNLNWKITNENKLIQKYESLKATTNFKGREYIAWFTTEIPSYFGPLKLHGLPGLILELTDSKNEVTLVTKKISFDFENIFIPEVTYKTITRKEYNKEIKNEIEMITQNISAKYGRGIKVKTSSISSKSLENEK